MILNLFNAIAITIGAEFVEVLELMSSWSRFDGEWDLAIILIFPDFLPSEKLHQLPYLFSSAQQQGNNGSVLGMCTHVYIVSLSLLTIHDYANESQSVNPLKL